MNKKLTYFSVFALNKKVTISAAFFAVLGVVAEVVIRQLSGRMIDRLDTGVISTWLWSAVIGISAILIITGFMKPLVKEVLSTQISQKIYARLEETALSAGMSALEQINLGEAGTYFTRDVNGILQYVNRILNFLVPDMLTFSFSLILIFSIHWSLGVVSIISSIIPVVLMKLVSKKLVVSNEVYQKTTAEAIDKVAESFYNIEFVKSNNMEDHLSTDYREVLEQLQGIYKKISRRESLLSAPTTFSAFITTLTIALVGGHLVTINAITIGMLFTVITLTDFVVSPVMRFENSLKQIRRVTVNLFRINHFLELPREEVYVPYVEKAEQLILKDVSFGYSNEKQIFLDLNLKLEPGRLNCIIGRNGVGKSTLLKLLGCVYEIQAGMVGMPVEEPFRKNIRENLVIHTQETLLFSDTILQNLTAGQRIDEDRVYRICREVGIDAEIRSFPDGYDTELMADGAPLSGGQRQRLCLVRTLLREAPMYIFDEPTTGIDPENIQNVIACIRNLAKNHLVLVITHEPLLIDAADTIIDLGEVQS